MSTCVSSIDARVCARCGGELYTELANDPNSSILSDILGTTFAVCFICGDRYDAVVLANRAKCRAMRMTECRCGCGELIPWYTTKDKQRQYLQGHASRKYVPGAR